MMSVVCLCSWRSRCICKRMNYFQTGTQVVCVYIASVLCVRLSQTFYKTENIVSLLHDHILTLAFPSNTYCCCLASFIGNLATPGCYHLTSHVLWLLSNPENVCDLDLHVTLVRFALQLVYGSFISCFSPTSNEYSQR